MASLVGSLRPLLANTDSAVDMHASAEIVRIANASLGAIIGIRMALRTGYGALGPFWARLLLQCGSI